MIKPIVLLHALLISSALMAQQANTSELPFKMEELTSPKFAKAVAKANGVCVIPLGIIEKHGPHLPLGSDLFESREAAFDAAKKGGRAHKVPEEG